MNNLLSLTCQDTCYQANKRKCPSCGEKATLLFGCEMCPSSQVCSDICSPIDSIFRKIAKPLEDGALLEEVGH